MSTGYAALTMIFGESVMLIGALLWDEKDNQAWWRGAAIVLAISGFLLALPALKHLAQL